MTRWIGALLTASLALAAAGCAAPSRDPSQVGLGGAIYNLTAGVYQEDDATIRREIASQEARRGELEAESRRLAAEARRLTGERRAATQRLSRLNAETAEMNARLAELSQREGADQRRLGGLRDRERDLSEQVIAAGAGGASAAEVARLEAEKARLLADIESLVGVS